MSIESWKQLYYPITAIEAAETLSPRDVIQHSLTKWRGLRPEILDKHGLKAFSADCTISDGIVTFCVTGASCSLCAKYYDYLYDEPSCCTSCPLAQLGASGTDCFNEFRYWQRTSDPEPMIALLETALATAEDK